MELESLAEGRSVALLCFEKAGDFCHRCVLAEWFGLDPDSVELKF